MNELSFDTKRIADGYLKRPWLHKQVIQQVEEFYQEKIPFHNGLDVGCGAGLSAKALKLVCNHVTGTDISKTMIDTCQRTYSQDAYTFYQARAEQIDIPKESYDIVTASGVINWVQQEPFLQKMSQVMAPQGVLVIYDFWITDRMLGQERYTTWYQEEYLKKFPKPMRNEEPWKQEELLPGFVLEHQNDYVYTYEYDMEEFIQIIMIQSNVNEQIANGAMTVEEVTEWMRTTLADVFEGQRKTLYFDGYTWCIKHQ